MPFDNDDALYDALTEKGEDIWQEVLRDADLTGIAPSRSLLEAKLERERNQMLTNPAPEMKALVNEFVAIWRQDLSARIRV